MYYCFLKEDINGLIQDPLNIQKDYAQHIGALCIGSLDKQAFFNASGREVSISNEEVLLRCSYDNLKAGLHLLEKHGANLMEAESDIEQIESWHTLELTSRQIWEADFPKLLMASSEILGDTDNLFLKSKHKGFSAVINPSRIMQRDPEVVAFLETQCGKYGNQVILSKYIPMKMDSLGIRETRHVILDNRLVNSSRFLHSIRHTVPRSHKTKAQELVLQIKKLGTFPSNYILDLGEFVDVNCGSYIDVVELNPLACSMCYVNNSIFNVVAPEIAECQKQLLMGYEFCYDAINNPQNYILTRQSNKSYSYASGERYFFD